MAWFAVKFPGRSDPRNINAADAQEAMSKAFMQATQPVYCRIHEGIADNSNAPVGEMGLWYPSSAYPVSAEPMREVYMGGGYCLIPT